MRRFSVELPGRRLLGAELGFLLSEVSFGSIKAPAVCRGVAADFEVFSLQREIGLLAVAL